MDLGLRLEIARLNLCGCGAQAKSNRLAAAPLRRAHDQARRRQTRQIAAERAQPLLAKCGGPGSGHGPGRLRGASVADEGQAQRPTLELACVARAGEVDLKADE